MKIRSILCVVGARPNFIKIAPILEEIRRRPQLTGKLVHTGQHFSPEMSDLFFSELGIPQPDVNLGIGGGTHTRQTAEIMLQLEPILSHHPPDLVLVVGDVNSTMATALVAAKLGIPLAHVEAGLRSFDRAMPEEINRIVTDCLSDYLFASEPAGVKNLLREGIPEQKIFFVGNVMIDTLLRFREKAAKSDVIERLRLKPGSFGVVTLHRPSDVDDPDRLKSLLQALATLTRRLPLVFPVHPRTRQKMESLGIPSGGFIFAPPLGYLDFVCLMDQARIVFTDSGGIQEETTILQVPCLTLRENTERPITTEQGTNRLAGVDPAGILRLAEEVLTSNPPAGRVPELWDGKASVRIIDILLSQGERN
jgi:UDP-N-acetylglucosamine 2-epimerase (non-hydrolysing)